MNRALIITSAGRSLRFGKSIGREEFKILYNEGDPMECLVSQQLDIIKDIEFSNIIIVGGYKFDELVCFIQKYYGDNKRIEVVYNDHYYDFGTCYSLDCGLKALNKYHVDEIVFMEGDLIVDSKTFHDVALCNSDVITANDKIISADKSVIFYVTKSGRLIYDYDVNHNTLQINEPFTILGNSGQIWKFCDPKMLFDKMEEIGGGRSTETNLLPIEHYFNNKKVLNTKFIAFESWYNCNTIEDFREIARYRRGTQ